MAAEGMTREMVNPYKGRITNLNRELLALNEKREGIVKELEAMLMSPRFDEAFRCVCDYVTNYWKPNFWFRARSSRFRFVILPW